MLGSEYNWLINFTRSFNRAPKITLAGTSWFTLIIAGGCLLCLALQASRSI